MKKLCGIYRVVCLVNGKCYIGQSENINQRIARHKTKLKGNYHHNKHLQELYNKYGAKSIAYEILELCPSDELDDKERYWIAYYGGMDSDTTCNYESGGRINKTCNKELRQTKSQLLKGKRVSPNTEFKKGIIVWNKGMKMPPEIIKKYSESHIGNKLKEETKRKISERLKKVKTSDTCYNSKRVLKIDINGNIVKEYYSLSEAGRDNNIASNNIKKRTEHNNRLYDNHYWKLKGETL